jgi:hypothetical protein
MRFYSGESFQRGERVKRVGDISVGVVEEIGAFEPGKPYIAVRWDDAPDDVERMHPEQLLHLKKAEDGQED